MSISQSKEHFDTLFQQKYHKIPVQLDLDFEKNKLKLTISKIIK